ncbi:hypothetical protein E24_00411 [Faustovirus]|nr:hypothetical protein PRJ_Fausto_00387 [Faustovirus]AMN83326.1 hypothetical protein E24_00411 [Faustovirus]AMN84310.1 hypothetical protein D5a_00410 [Faustovirus]AMN85296.1 hypothetical protein E23_00411 [Faustovirus]QBR99292.1 hypothetical protein [Faustovirus mariensis]
METISKILEYSKQKLNKVVNGITEYYKNIEKVVQLNNALTHDKFISAEKQGIELVKKLNIKSASTTSITYTLEELAEFYATLDRLVYTIDYMIGVINDPYYTKLHVINMSQTFIDDINKKKNLILDEYDEFKDTSVDSNDTIYQLSFRDFDYIKNKTEVNKLLLKYKHNTNKFIIALIDHIYSPDDPILNSYIEGMKNITLSDGYTEQDDTQPGSQRYIDNKHLGYINYILGRGGLAPVTSSQSIDKIMGLLTDGTYSNVENIDSAIKLIETAGLKYDVWVIIKHVLTPLEFDIRPLVDKQYLIENGLYLPVDHVLDNAMLKKTNTSYMLTQSGGGKDNIEKVIKIPGDSSKCIIIESLTDGLYRILSNTGEYLSDPLLVNVDKGSAIRPLLYNNIINDEILNNKGFKNHTALLNKFKNEYKATSLPADTVMTKVKEELKNQIEKLVKSDKHKNENEFIALATDMTVLASAINKVLPMKEIDGNGRMEYTITYLIRINDISFDFTKKFSNILLEKGIRKFYNNKNTLLQICNDSIDATVASMHKAGKWSDFEYSFKEFIMDNEFVIM